MTTTADPRSARSRSGPHPDSRAHSSTETRARLHAELRAGAVQMLPIVAGYVPFGVLVGVTVRHSVDPVAAWSGTLPIYGGTAQLTLLQLLGGGAGILSAVGAALLVNARLLVYSVAFLPLFRSARLPVRLLAAAFIIDPTWMLATRRAQAPGSVVERRWHYAGGAAVLTVGWLSLVTLGLALGQVDTRVLAVVGPLCLLAMVAPQVRLPGGAVAVAAAVTVTLAGVALQVPSGLATLAAMAGAAAGGLAATRKAMER